MLWNEREREWMGRQERERERERERESLLTLHLICVHSAENRRKES